MVWVTLLSCRSEWPDEVATAYAELPEHIDFNRHIRPILADRCWSCHGPDARARQAKLRLDREEAVYGLLASGAGRAIVPGRPHRSLALTRMLSSDPDQQMPPPESNLSLSAREIALVAKWIEQGAEWRDHWAFLPIEEPELPPAPHPSWTEHNPIDRLINTRLAEAGLKPNGPADSARLLRRLYLDLTGLPPTPAQTDAFLADRRPQAYERVVEELLASTACAERLTMDWLDLARYADSHGMHADGWRNAWPWRDWVIEAFARNMPYDAFVTQQLAGDLLPQPTSETILATAFNRNHPMTAEGGAIDEEFRLSYVFDRVNTVATGVLGLTMDCARCHDHKFDPLSQKEYYQFSAFFDNIRELGMTGDDGNYGPYLLLSDPATDSLLGRYENQIAHLERKQAEIPVDAAALRQFLDDLDPQVSPAAVRTWPLDRLVPHRGEWKIAAHWPRTVRDGYRVDGTEVWASSETSLDTTDRGLALRFDHAYDEVVLRGIGSHEAHEPFSAGVWIKTTQRDSTKDQFIIGATGEKNNFWRGWDFYLDGQNRLNARLVHNLPDDLIWVRSADSVRVGEWTHVAFRYDGSTRAAGLQLYLDGRPAATDWSLDRLRGTIYPVAVAIHVPRARDAYLGRSYRKYTGDDGIYSGWMDELFYTPDWLSDHEIAALAGKPYTAISPTAAGTYLRRRSPPFRKREAQLARLRAARLALLDSLPRVMVMEELPQPRPTYVLDRGAYDAPRERVQPATPEHILPFPDHLPRNRLGLASWLFLPDNPLTARVAVNRYWQLLFGRGLVATTHDFGSQGSLPTHPRLLDYLAHRFRTSGWDVRDLLRTIVTSATYRRSSVPTEEQRALDPENEWLARAPSFRLPAEMIRDNALAASGLLHRSAGGPSVKPYQPEGLWIQKNSFSHALLRYEPDTGNLLYRRSMYTFIKRTSPPPFMINFDATGRDACLVKRETTNTPLQALNLLNDPQFVEAARVLAQRVLRERDSSDEQLTHAFRLVTSRRPAPAELAVLQELYNAEAHRFRSDPTAATELLAVGEYPIDPALDPIAIAALTQVGSTLLNFDEAYTRR